MDFAARPAEAGADHAEDFRGIYDHACSLPAEQRVSYLDAVCGQDSSLRAQVQALLGQADGGRQAEHGIITPATGPERLGRFALLRKLGEGGMGRVYEAWDTQNEARVALKTISRSDPGRLFLFKQEFRTSSQIAHRNLIALYELFAETGTWFFTMEYLSGRTFLDHYQPTGTTSAEVATGDSTATQTMGQQTMASGALLRRSKAVTDFQALRPGLRQLAEGVAALHQAGKLHRDIKSANVMVTDEGRVVLLDFGLMIDAGIESDAWLETQGAGTVAYMAPEQIAGRQLAPAADWYAVGVILYRALTGQTPYTGTPKEIIRAKEAADPLPPRTLSSQAPEDLCRLCMAMLSREPSQRPNASQILKALGEGPVVTHRPLSRSVWIGREKELAELREAAAAAHTGSSVVMLVSGASGMGKSALVERALKELDGPDAMILGGRCGEQEFVPYRALDGVMDTLAHRLARLPVAECAALLPPEMPALTRLFPSMSRLLSRTPGSIAAGPQTTSAEQRRRGVGALGELLRRLGLRRRLVLSIDDMQWGDVDSALMLDQILHAPNAPRLLLIGTCRAEQEGSSEFVKILTSPPEGSPVSIRRLALGPLAVTDAAGLVRMARTEDSQEQTEALLTQAGGNTYLLLELLTQAATPRAGGSLSLDDLLWERVETLPEPAQRLLAVTSLSARPVRHEILLEAAHLTGADRYALTALRNHRLVRTSQSGRPEIEPFHDRVREAVRARLQPEAVRACHASLAEVWERIGDAEPEDLATHHHGAGNLHRAATYYVQAAERSAQALAFDRAASQWRLALENGEWDAPQRRKLRGNLAEALVNGGRSADAAVEFEALLEGAAPGERAELSRRSAYYYCLSGQMKEGKQRLRQVLNAHGVSLPASPKAAMLPLLWTQTKARIRGYGFRIRPEAEVPSALLARVDDFWAAGTGLASAELITGAYFMTRCVQASLEAGEPSRLARALACESFFLAMKGRKGLEKARQLLTVCDRLLERVHQPQVTGMVHLARSLVAGSEHRHSDAIREANLGAEIFRNQCQGANWELYMCRMIALLYLSAVGDYGPVRRLVDEYMAEARASRDLNALTELVSGVQPVLHIIDDQLDVAARGLDSSLATAGEGTTQYFQALQLRLLLDAYSETPENGLVRFRKLGWKTRLGMRMVQDSVRVNIFYALGCCALATGDRSAKPQSSAREAQAIAGRIMRIEDGRVSQAHAAALCSGAAMLLGRPQQALDQARKAMSLYREMELMVFAAAAQRRVGLLTGGAEGNRLMEDAERAMVERTIRNPARVTRAHLPGFRRLEQVS